MTLAKSTLVLHAVLAAFGIVAGEVYSPYSCAYTCGPGDFIQELSSVSIGGGENRAHFWATVALLQIEENLSHLSPPAVARISAIVGSCLYEAAAIHHKGYSKASATHMLTQRTRLHEELESNLHIPHGFAVRDGNNLLQDTLDGAGFWAMRAIFGQRDSFSDVYNLYSQVGDLYLDKLVPIMDSAHSTSIKKFGHSTKPPAASFINAATFGASVCQMVVDQYAADGFKPDGTLGGRPDPTNYMPVNAPQRLAGVTDCDNEIVVPGAWQPLCMPNSSDDFGTTNCKAQTALAPFAGRFTTFALADGDETTSDELAGPPPLPGSKQFEREWREVLEINANIDDVDKIIAEYWADGPDSTAPPGHWFKIAADAAFTEGLDATDTAKLLFVVGNALNDAGVASWRVKFDYDSSRPLQLIQCGDFKGQTKKAWRGPYLGVGSTNISEWRPYQAADAESPPFPGYVSGHSTFSAAAAEAMTLFFGSDSYKGPQCFRTREGESLFEPRSDAMPGFSDIPNTGFDTVGYVPREDVVLCWNTYKEAADQAGESRLLGGIHVRADDVIGRIVGRKVGRDVFFKALTLMHD